MLVDDRGFYVREYAWILLTHFRVLEGTGDPQVGEETEVKRAREVPEGIRLVDTFLSFTFYLISFLFFLTSDIPVLHSKIRCWRNNFHISITHLHLMFNSFPLIFSFFIGFVSKWFSYQRIDNSCNNSLTCFYCIIQCIAKIRLSGKGTLV